nr:MAG TPA: hypothetical protein [Caudoviricetes sp.]
MKDFFSTYVFNFFQYLFLYIIYFLMSRTFLIYFY